MYGEGKCVTPIDPIERASQLEAENAALKRHVDESERVIAELKKVHEKDKNEIQYLRSECDVRCRNVHILEAQMEVVRLIFGKGGCNG